MIFEGFFDTCAETKTDGLHAIQKLTSSRVSNSVLVGELIKSYSEYSNRQGADKSKTAEFLYAL